MSAREFIVDLLDELGEKDLAQRVSNKLAHNEDAGLILRFADEGTPREVNLHFNQIVVEME